jgi:hypothetical protein
MAPSFFFFCLDMVEISYKFDASPGKVHEKICTEIML